MPVDYNLSAAIWNGAYQGTTFLAALLTCILTSITLIVLVKNRNSISKYFRLLINFSLQNTINELHQKLNQLNSYDFDIGMPEDKREIICLFHEICGQIEGNEHLKERFENELKDFDKYASNPTELSDARKRRLITTLREKLRNLNLDTYIELAGGKK